MNAQSRAQALRHQPGKQALVFSKQAFKNLAFKQAFNLAFNHSGIQPFRHSNIQAFGAIALSYPSFFIDNSGAEFHAD